MRRGRETRFGRSGGTNSFVCSSVSGTQTLYQIPESHTDKRDYHTPHLTSRLPFAGSAEDARASGNEKYVPIRPETCANVGVDKVI